MFPLLVLAPVLCGEFLNLQYYMCVRNCLLSLISFLTLKTLNWKEFKIRRLKRTFLSAPKIEDLLIAPQIHNQISAYGFLVLQSHSFSSSTYTLYMYHIQLHYIEDTCSYS